jgi:hypothetical protein
MFETIGNRCNTHYVSVSVRAIDKIRPHAERGPKHTTTTMNKKNTFKHILASAEYRDLSNELKVVALIEDYGVTQTDTAVLMKMGRKQVRNILKAHHEKRECSITGRPTLLQEREESELIDWVKDQDSKCTPVTYKQFQKKV